MLRQSRVATIVALCTVGLGAQAVRAQDDPTELAKKTQNPVSDLVSIPFQFNFNTGGDLDAPPKPQAAL